MSTDKRTDKICIIAVCLCLVITVLFMNGEKLGITVIHGKDEAENGMFTENDLDGNWNTDGATVINLDNSAVKGNGAYFNGDTLNIVYAGKYVVSGKFNGSITVDADGDDKIRILFDGVDITSENTAPLYINSAEKVFLTLNKNSDNKLTYGNTDTDELIDGAIYSRDDLTLNGEGRLTVVSDGLHGIVCNDTLKVTGGVIDITAKKDGVHAHDGVKICNTSFKITAEDDGIHAGNDDETSVFYMESGSIDIVKCYEGIEANDITVAGGSINITPEDDGLNANGSGKTSVITVTGGDITVINKNGRDADGFDSNGNIYIKGGNIFISLNGNGTNNAVDYGSETGGIFKISGGTLIACGSSQMAEAPETDSEQGFIFKNISGNAESELSLTDGEGNTLISKEIPCSYTSVLISLPGISVGDVLTLKTGEEENEITVDNSSDNGGNTGFAMQGFNGMKPGREQGEMQNGEPPELPDGERPLMQNGEPPEKPDGEQGEIRNGEPPEKPDGERPQMQDGEPPEKPDGEQGEMQNGEPPELPDGERPQMQDGEPPEKPDGEQRNNKPEQNSLFDGKNSNGKDFVKSERIENGAVQGGETETDSRQTVKNLVYIAVSVIILIFGIIVAYLKKYR